MLLPVTPRGEKKEPEMCNLEQKDGWSGNNNDTRGGDKITNSNLPSATRGLIV